MRDIKVKQTTNNELESVMPIDRVTSIDSNNIVYLGDTQFVIDESQIEEVINEY